jgi:glycosyltransferase involved in cell wall biosynthesis
MRVALVTTPPSVRSGIADYTRHLLPYLREHCEVEVFVHHGHDEPEWGDEKARLASDLHPRDFNQILYQLGNEMSHAFMPRMIRALGGTVMQHDWVLFDMAMAAWPALARGGAKGHAVALREGGLFQTHRYLRNWMDRRRQRTRPEEPPELERVAGVLPFGWHAPESEGRWAADWAAVRLPAREVQEVRIVLHVDAGRQVRVHHEGRVVVEGDGTELAFRTERSDEPLFLIETTGVRITRLQRQYGDSRRMGCFVQKIVYRDSRGEHEVDLSSACSRPPSTITLSRDRFDLPFNRSVVRFGDSFLVHSEYVGDRIRKERNAPTPMGVVHHGSERRWREGDRGDTRMALGLPPDWRDACLVVSFGGVQPHKRIDKVLAGLAEARRTRDDIRLVLAGTISSDGLDPRALAKSLGIEDSVRFTGFLPESEAWEWLHAGDFSINLRGPTSGGTSGGIFQAFSMGRPVIVSDAAEQKELPDDCVVRVPLGENEVPALARELVALRDDGQRRSALEAAVRSFVDEECHWSVVARKYFEHMQGFPRARASRRKLIALRAGLQRSAL